jgi:hypothetical protein
MKKGAASQDSTHEKGGSIRSLPLRFRRGSFKTKKNYAKRDGSVEFGQKRESATRWVKVEQKRRTATNWRKFAHIKKAKRDELAKTRHIKKGIDQCRKSAKSVFIHSGRR